MTEFKAGDIVRLTIGEPDKPGYRVEVRTVTEGISKGSKINLRTLEACEDDYWTVELIERPAPLLPTTPNTLGWATVGGVRCAVRRNVGTWNVYDEGGFTYYIAQDEDLSDFTEAALIPKDLADKVMEWAERDAMDGYRLLGDLADHLKGQDDE